MPTVEEYVEERTERRGNGGKAPADGPIAERVSRMREHLSDAAERKVRDVKRLARKSQFAVENQIDAAALRVRRNPGTALAIAFAVGSISGVVAGLMLRRRRRTA
ncbi:MAG TPA: hypothetical protein VL383_02640 [Gemmatimonadaceae bacterium]|jgi:ElaB/YqjD/DUF883 family membrane-anchored ribosome-binding protein|nr:hypothetical protein [Gemmatimonadaceae bacterium]